MRMTVLQCAMSAAGAGMLAITPMTGSLNQTEAELRAPNQFSQYCAPPQEDAEAPKLYCRQHGNAVRNTEDS
jgi:hypothetical protein